MIRVCLRIGLIIIVSGILILYGLSLGRNNQAIAMVYNVAKILGLGSGSNLPICPDSKGIDMPESDMCNLKVKGEAYQTRSMPSSVLKYYSKYLAKNGEKVYQKMLTPEFGFAISSNMRDKMQSVLVCRDTKKQQSLVLPFKTQGDLVEWAKKIGSGEDTPGKDIKGIPRHPDSVRKFSMGQELKNVGFNIASYETGSSPENALAFYRINMLQNGWEMTSAPQLGNGNILLFHREEKQVVVNAFREEETGKTTIMTMEQRMK